MLCGWVLHEPTVLETHKQRIYLFLILTLTLTVVNR